jgi:hypothetical protein
MSDQFNSLTITAACQVIGLFNSHDDLALLEAEWDISGQCSSTSKSGRAADLARLAKNPDCMAMTANGKTTLARAIIEKAVCAPIGFRDKAVFLKFTAGLRFDGFEIVSKEKIIQGERSWIPSTSTTEYSLCSIYPQDVPSLDFREAESEIKSLLQRHNMMTCAGHLDQAISAFSRGEWAAANSQMRTFIEDLFCQFAIKTGYQGKKDIAADVRSHLGTIQQPFLYGEYNEWFKDTNKPQFISGVWSRLHPQGSHPGLSEEDDATFRLHIILITSRLFLRRFSLRA